MRVLHRSFEGLLGMRRLLPGVAGLAVWLLGAQAAVADVQVSAPVARAAPLPTSGATCPVGSAAVSGQTVVAVGSADIGGQARAVLYVFTEPLGAWSGTVNQAAVLAASDGSDLGPIAISGETVVALGGATNDQGGRQSVYVFTEPPGGWSGTIHEAAKLSASDGAYFGSVAIDGQTVVAAADDNAQGHENPAYVFTEPAGGWSRTLHESAKLADAGGAGILSVAISGQTVVASTVVYRALLGGIDVFTAPPGGWSGTLNETADLGGGSWGSAAISGDTVFATSKLSSGVSVFSEPSGGWSGTLQAGAQLTASDGASLYVAGSSDRTVIAGGATAAYVFTEPPSGWASESQAARLTNPSGQPYSVGISAQTVVESGNGSADYVFAQPSSGWSDEGPTATLAATGVPRTWAGAMRGFSVGKPKLTLKLTAGCFPPTYSVTISLPRGLAFNRNRRTLARALHLTPAGKFTFTTLTPAKLRVELNKPAALADLTINPPGLIESKALIARVKAHRRSPMPSIGLRISDAGGNNTGSR